MECAVRTSRGEVCVDIAHDLGHNRDAVAHWHKKYEAAASFEDRPQSGRRHATSTTMDQIVARMAQTSEDPTNALLLRGFEREQGGHPSGWIMSCRLQANGLQWLPNRA